MKTSRSKCFACTGAKAVDVTVKPEKNELVLVDLGMLNDIYLQGFFDGVSDAVGEPAFFSVHTVEAEDEHA